MNTTLLRRFLMPAVGGSLLLVIGLARAAEPAPEPAKPAASATPATKAPARKPAAPKPAEKKLAPSNLGVAQIVERNATARGGLKAWRAVKTLSMSGTMDVGRPVKPREQPATGTQLDRSRSKLARYEAAKAQAEKDKQEPGQIVQVPFVMELKRPRMMRLEVKFEGDTAIQVYDGQKGWKLRPYLGRNEVEPYTADELKIAAQQTPLDGPLIDYAAKGYKVVVEGMEPVDGHNAYRLKVTLKGGQVRHVWVDATSFLDVQIDETRRLGGHDRAVITAMRNYQTVNGLKVPFLLETRVDGAVGSDKIQVEKVAINPPIDDARFVKLK